MKRFHTLAVIAATLFLTACESWDVKSDYDPEMSFTDKKTYAIIQDAKIPNDILHQQDIVRKRILMAVDSQLTSKGLTKVTDPASADLAVLVYAGVRERVNYSTVGMSYGGYWGYGGPGMQTTQVVENRYAEGTLHIDMFDAKKKMLAWKGEATGALHQANSPEERQAMANDVVSAILRSFPPGQK
jgi:hypothetical protein